MTSHPLDSCTAVFEDIVSILKAVYAAVPAAPDQSRMLEIGHRDRESRPTLS